MLRTTILATSAILLTAPAFAMGCNYGKHTASASAETAAPEYSPVAASTTTEQSAPLQSTPIDPAAIVYEESIQIETVEPVLIPEG